MIGTIITGFTMSTHAHCEVLCRNRIHQNKKVLLSFVTCVLQGTWVYIRKAQFTKELNWTVYLKNKVS